MADLYTRYFLFSQDHYDKVKAIEEKAGNRNYKFGTVLVGGYPKIYTIVTRNPTAYTQRYGDAKIVLSGDIRKVRYTDPD